jgi:hypothetical protein
MRSAAAPVLREMHLRETTTTTTVAVIGTHIHPRPPPLLLPLAHPDRPTSTGSSAAEEEKKASRRGLRGEVGSAGGG